MNEKLAARVKAVNKANEYAMELYSILAPIFTPLVGSNILKNDGSLLAKYDKLLPELPSSFPLRAYRHRSNYSLVWMVNASESVGSCTSMSHEIGVYVGEINGKTLTKLYDPPKYRTDYTVEDVLQRRQAYAIVKKAAAAAESDLHPFGEYDH